MLRTCSVACAAVAGVVIISAAVGPAAGEGTTRASKQIEIPAPIPKDAQADAAAPHAAAAKAAASAQKTRTGVKIEVKIPTRQKAPASKDAARDAEATDSKTASPAASKSWPKTLDEDKAEKEALKQPPPQWTAQEIADAKARCAVILKRIHGVAIPQEPVKEGMCGAPAPVQLIAIGSNPEVALSPPAVVNCDFAEALQGWVENDVQSLAKKHLGANVIKIEVMSSYSCRNAYGRAGNKLSEHGLANALDIRGFVTSAGKTAYVLEDWGTTQRETLAKIAAEKAKAAKALAAEQAAQKAAQEAQASSKNSTKTAATPPPSTGSSAGAPAAGIARSTIVEGTPRLTVTLPGAGGEPADPSESGFSMAPSRLGGPKVQIELKVKTPGATDEKSKAQAAENKETFLHAAHAAACRLFGTTLGPEANAAHRNHLHVDMAPRKTTKICD